MLTQKEGQAEGAGDGPLRACPRPGGAGPRLRASVRGPGACHGAPSSRRCQRSAALRVAGTWAMSAQRWHTPAPGALASTFPWYSAATLSASGPRPLRRPPQRLSCPRARRRRRYVDGPRAIGTGSPTSACTGSTGPSAPLPRAGAVAVPMPVLCVAVPRVLPGFSGSSQVRLPRM